MECTEYRRWSPTALDHAEEPRKHGPLSEFNGQARVTGSCADTMEFWLLVQNDKVEKASFITDGCGSTRACGSIATYLAASRSIEEAAALRQQDIVHALGGCPSKSGTLPCWRPIPLKPRAIIGGTARSTSLPRTAAVTRIAPHPPASRVRATRNSKIDKSSRRIFAEHTTRFW